MRPAFNNFFALLRTLTAVLLLLSISLKVVTAAFCTDTKKEAFATNKTEGNDEKKAETDNSPEKDPELFELKPGHSYHHLSFVLIEHYTAYRINYFSTYYSKITIPPPDNNLHT